MKEAQYHGWEEGSVRPEVQALLGNAEAITYEMLIHTPLVGSDGIPLNSDRVVASAKVGIDFDYRLCPYKDSPSRQQDQVPENHKVPMSGLEQQRLRNQYPEMLDFVAAFREVALSEGNVAKRPLRLDESLILCEALKYLPSYLAFRSYEPVPPNQIPPFLIVLANSAAGASGALGGLMYTDTEDFVEEQLAKVPDTDYALEKAEQNGRLIGENTVCAASPRMIKGFLEAVVYGRHSNPNAFANIQPDITEKLTEIDIANVISYAGTLRNCELLLRDAQALDAAALDELGKLYIKKQKAASIGAAGLRELGLASNSKAIRELHALYGAEIGRLIEEMSAHETRMNHTLGRKAPAVPPVSLLHQAGYVFYNRYFEPALAR